MLFTKLFSNASGLSGLRKVYGTTPKPAGQCIAGQTIQVGKVRYRRCVSLNCSPEGFYFEVRTAFDKGGPVLIPWDVLRQSGTTNIYREPAVKLMAGKPFIAEIAIPG